MGISLSDLETYCCGCNRWGNPNIRMEAGAGRELIYSCFDCIEIANDLVQNQLSKLIGIQSLTSELNSDLSLIPNRAIEFVGLDVKDSIQLGDQIEYIHHWEQDKITQQKRISFMVGDSCNQLTQHEYINQGWRKVVD